MTLTVRLKPELESALSLYCAERGVAKSLVVQEVLTEYLARPARRKARVAGKAAAPVAPGAAYRAFERAGLIGCVEKVGPADKAGVRAAIQHRAEAKQAARQAAASAAAAGAPKAAKRRAAC